MSNRFERQFCKEKLPWVYRSEWALPSFDLVEVFKKFYYRVAWQLRTLSKAYMYPFVMNSTCTNEMCVEVTFAQHILQTFSFMRPSRTVYQDLFYARTIGHAPQTMYTHETARRYIGTCRVFVEMNNKRLLSYRSILWNFEPIGKERRK